jgi:DNA-binding transcriptional LysR family regulator
METAGKLAGLESFAAVVQHGGFSRAAEALGVSKSTISKQVTRLEQRLGVKLLSRTTRAVNLTSAGAAFHARVSELVVAADAAAREVTEQQVVPQGLLRVTAPAAFGHRYLGPVVTQFLCAYRDVELELDLSDRAIDIAREGFDVAIRVGPTGDDTLVSRTICSARVAVVGAPSYFERMGTPRRPEDLSKHECLLYTYQALGDRWAFQRKGAPFTVGVRGRLRSTSAETLTEAARAGVGLAMLPHFFIEDDVAAGRMREVLTSFAPPPSPVRALYKHRGYLPAAARAFIDLAAEILAARAVDGRPG